MQRSKPLINFTSLPDILTQEQLLINDENTALQNEVSVSLYHLQLANPLEKKFDFRFHSRKIKSSMNLSDLIDCIESKTKAA